MRPDPQTWFGAVYLAWTIDYEQPTQTEKFPQGTPARVPTVVWSPFTEPPMFHQQPDEWWPGLIPSSEYADFSYDATNDLAPGDSIVGLSLRVSPSGAGEVTMSRLALMNTPLGTPTLPTVWLTGGVPGRVYLYELVMTTAQIRVIVILIGQRCAPVLAYIPIPPPPNPGFGSAVTWP